VICLAFVFCYLKFLITKTRTLTPAFSDNMLSEKWAKVLDIFKIAKRRHASQTLGG
jgi:hypothetical protein